MAQLFWCVAGIQLLEFKGDEVINHSAKPKRIVQLEDGGWLTGKYYKDREKAIEALNRVIERKLNSAERKRQIQLAVIQALQDLRDHWGQELKKEIEGV